MASLTAPLLRGTQRLTSLAPQRTSHKGTLAALNKNAVPITSSVNNVRQPFFFSLSLSLTLSLAARTQTTYSRGN